MEGYVIVGYWNHQGPLHMLLWASPTPGALYRNGSIGKPEMISLVTQHEERFQVPLWTRTVELKGTCTPKETFSSLSNPLPHSIYHLTQANNKYRVGIFMFLLPSALRVILCWFQAYSTAVR